MGKTFRIVTAKSSDKFVCIDEGKYTFPRMDDIPNNLKYNQHYEAIKNTIKDGLAISLTDLLTYDMQCSTVDAQQGRWSSNDNYRIPSLYGMYTRPFIEWMFFEKRDDFHDLVQCLLFAEPTLLTELNNRENLCRAFIDSLKETDLQNPLLFELAPETQALIKNDIQKLNNHATLIAEEDELAKNRSIALQELTNNLLIQLNSFPNDALPSKPDNTSQHIPTSLNALSENTRKLCILNFKLNFIKTMHSKDKSDPNTQFLGLASHRDGGSAMITSNLVSILFTGGIANLLLGIATQGSRWLFFQSTETQALMRNLEQKMGIQSSQSDAVTNRP